MNSTALHALHKAIQNPERAALRLLLKARIARTPLRKARYRLLGTISKAWNVDAWEYLREYRASAYARWCRQRLLELGEATGNWRMGTSGAFHSEALYVLVRAARPATVVETGVLYGTSSGHILAALEANGTGRLHSIDLGNSPGEPPHDFMVRPEFLHRWDYIEGDSRDELPRLLQRVEAIDMFHHDSLHTFEHMTGEFETVLPYVAPGGVIASHDVFVSDSLKRIWRQNAFPTFCRRHSLRHLMIRNSGIARVRRRASSRSVPATPSLVVA
jgi:predicted O-methyltransferase YrrM